jgi:GMP synthase (glutamine-hydrolysing)
MIIVLNFGGQFAHLIARRIRELKCFTEIISYDTPYEEIKKLNPKGIILSGSPNSVNKKGAPFCSKKILDLNIPILGICYGHQLLIKMLGGKVESGKVREYGKEVITIKSKKGIFQGLKNKEQVWFSHGDIVIKLPKYTEIIAETDNCPVAAFSSDKNKIYGVQFHPEVVHTLSGDKILSNFVFNICKAEKNWKAENFKNQLISDVKKEVGNDAVIIGVSGGVDSMVAAALLHRAIGNNLYCVFIDNGLMRKNEVSEVRGVFKKVGFRHFYMVNAKNDFLDKLKGVTDPEKKRKIIGRIFIRIFEKKAGELKNKADIKFLAQGTIYPDRIESAQPNKSAAKIKSHHNLALPKKMKFKIIEPLRELYKDEVRDLGRELKISKDIINRHPFPGPGLAIRIIGNITKERLRILREVDYIYISELKRTGQYDKIWQAFAALLPLKSVGVMGDQRTYEYIATLRAVTSIDGMTADWAKIPYNVLEDISNKIVNRVKGVNRVLFDISQKPPSTIEYQ